MGRLLNASGNNLDGEATLISAGWQTEACLTLQVGSVQICAGRETSGFAAVLGDGSVVTWGDRSCGGDSDSSAVQDQLKNVQRLQWGFHCHAGRWVCRHMGRQILWWRR